MIHHHREMWKAVSEAMVERAQGTPQTWLNHYQRLYVDGQVMALRRLIRSGGKDTITLIKLMESIIKHPEPLGLERYLHRWSQQNDSPLMLDLGRRDYEELWSDGIGNLDLDKVYRDKAELNRIAGKVIDFADRSVAHVVDGRPHFPLTFAELDAAIDGASEVFQRYTGLVTTTYYAHTPVVQEDWMSTFYRPIFPAPDWWTPPDGP